MTFTSVFTTVLRSTLPSLAVATIYYLLSTIYLANTAFAQSQFSASYNVTYQVQTSGMTQVVQAIGLRNLTANFYATEYSLSIGATSVINAVATDSSGAGVPVAVSTEGGVTKIKVTFREKVVGLNRVLNFTLRYESSDIAVKNGFVWEVTIPRLASPEGIESYNLVLKAPKEIGSVASISPQPSSTGGDDSFNTFTYNKEQMSKSGVNASFGDHQVFNFTLKYHLENTRFFPVTDQIALPPDTETQTVTYTKLDPLPSEISVDTDGNYLARYRLDGNSKVDITLEGQVKIWNKPTNPPRFAWTEEQLAKYTAPNKYWESNFPSIMEKAMELKTAQAIYDYVSTTLKYDYERAAGNLERLGASVAIAQPNRAVCMEYNDLFVAMARAAGIPARELNGFAYTTNTKIRPRTFSANSTQEKIDILHAWPEYWDMESKRWIQIDPTWGSTTGGVDYFNKLDMNHFVFAVKGLSSVEPFPAGSYKTDPENQDGDVIVTLAPTETEVSVKPNFTWEQGETLIGGLPFSGQITVQNLGNSSIFDARLTLDSDLVTLGETYLGPIPPLSTKTLVVSGKSDSIFTSATEDAKITLTGIDAKGQPVSIELTKTLTVKPLHQAVFPWLATFATLAGLIFVFLKIRFRLWRYLQSRFPPLPQG